MISERGTPRARDILSHVSSDPILSPPHSLDTVDHGTPESSTRRFLLTLWS